jgi:hypothetical protein
MKKPTADRLSAHLLHEARRFMIYPDKRHRTPGNLEMQQFFDDNIGQALLTERETFMLGRIGSGDPAKLALFFDELYCRALLAATSVDTSKPAIGGRVKTGHFGRGRDRLMFTAKLPPDASRYGASCASSWGRT